MSIRLKALLVHFFTATGAVFAMFAMLAAVDAKWDLMFLWLVVAFAVDGIDGPLARRYHVKKNAPEYDGVLLDLIIDYLTYVFIPAFALFKNGLLDGWTGWICLIIITFSSVIYFVDTRMKTKDNSFAGFPGCWNMFILVMFAITPSWQVILILTIFIAASQFTNLKFIHPVRTERWRVISLPIAALWTILGGYAAWVNFDIGSTTITLLSMTSLYLMFVGIVQQIFPEKQTKSASI
jgi:phosphatidylcholine synthase